MDHIERTIIRVALLKSVDRARDRERHPCGLSHLASVLSGVATLSPVVSQFHQKARSSQQKDPWTLRLRHRATCSAWQNDSVAGSCSVPSTINHGTFIRFAKFLSSLVTHASLTLFTIVSFSLLPLGFLKPHRGSHRVTNLHISKGFTNWKDGCSRFK